MARENKKHKPHIMAKDRIGEKHSMLTVIGVSYIEKRHTYFQVKCDCGELKILNGHHVFSGKTNSCGCLLKENHAAFRIRKTTHGKSYTATYQRYIHAKVFNKKHGFDFKDEWDDYTNFLKDMGEKPPGTYLRRIDKSKGFIRGNVEWKDFKTERYD